MTSQIDQNWLIETTCVEIKFFHTRPQLAQTIRFWSCPSLEVANQFLVFFSLIKVIDDSLRFIATASDKFTVK